MTKELVKRLKDLGQGGFDLDFDALDKGTPEARKQCAEAESLACEAADEIERLRAARQRLRAWALENGKVDVLDLIDTDGNQTMFSSASPSEPGAVSPDEGFQARVYDWMAKCFMRPDSMLPVQRSFRFVEEALELAQASGTSREEALRLVEYVYGRPSGLIGQEIGGVMVTLSGLATSFGLSMEYAGNAELARCEENTEKIRAKDLAKPQRSPLPGPTPSRT